MKGFMTGAAVAISAARTLNRIVLSDTRFGSELRKNVMKHLTDDSLILFRKEIELELSRRLRAS